MQEIDLSTLPGVGGTTPVSEAPREQTLGRDEFLKLLIAQLQNQDPLSPEDPSKFVSELTQFSNLEQLIGIREGVEAIQASNTQVQGVLDAAPLIGREVLAAGQRVEIDAEGRGSFAYDLPRQASVGTLVVRNAGGLQVAEHTLTKAELGPGRHRLEVEFLSAGDTPLAPGVYTYEIDASVSDAPVTATPYISGTATGARAASLGGEVSVLVGAIEVPLSATIEVKDPNR